MQFQELTARIVSRDPSLALHKSYGLVEVVEGYVGYTDYYGETVLVRPVAEDALTMINMERDHSESLGIQLGENDGIDGGQPDSNKWLASEFEEVSPSELIPLNTLSKSVVDKLINGVKEVYLTLDYSQYPWEAKDDDRLPSPSETESIMPISDHIGLTELGQMASLRRDMLVMYEGRNVVWRYNPRIRKWEEIS